MDELGGKWNLDPGMQGPGPFGAGVLACPQLACLGPSTLPCTAGVGGRLPESRDPATVASPPFPLCCSFGCHSGTWEPFLL